MSVFGFVIWFTANGQFLSNVICKNTITLSILDLSVSIFLKTMKNTTSLWRTYQRKEETFPDEPRRQMKIELGYLSGGLAGTVGLDEP